MIRRSSRTLLRFALVAFSLSCATPRPAPVAAASNEASVFLGNDREATFRAYVADIRDGHLLSKSGLRRLGTTWEAELERSHERFLRARSKDDVYYALLSLKNSIHDGHSDLTVPDSLKPRRERVEIPVKLGPDHPEGGALRLIVTDSALANVKKGFILEQYEGRKVGELVHEFVEWHRSSSPEHLEFELARWLVSRDSMKSPLPDPRWVTLLFRDPATGVEVSARVEFTQARIKPEFDYPLQNDADYAGLKCEFSGLNYCVYPDAASKTLVIRYFSFLYEFASARLWNRMIALSYKPEALAPDGHSPSTKLNSLDVDRLAGYLKSMNAEYSRILVDLRENTGGDLNLRFLRLLAGRPFQSTTRAVTAVPLMARDPEFKSAAIGFSVGPAMAAQIKRELEAGAGRSSVFAFDCKTESCSAKEAMVEPQDFGLHYAISLLTGPYCLSSCDQFVSMFRDNSLGETLGLPTQGASAPFRAPKRFLLANGESFSITLNVGITYRVNGEVLEGNPTAPSTLIYPGDDYLAQVLRALK